MDSRLQKLQYLFNPRSIAFVGATDKLDKWGFIIFNNIITGRWEGKLYPVNPGRQEVLGYPVFPNVRDLPGEIDLAVITVPAAAAPAALDDCIAKGVKAAIVISAGFKEMGGAAADAEDEMVARARAAGMVMVGPNGQGICCPARRLYAWMPHFFYPPSGPVAVISQSGNVQGMAMEALLELGVGISKGVSSGNEADLRTEDYFDYLAEDPDTKVILSYMEGLTDGRRFLEIATRTARKKPIVVLKGGRSSFGVSAAKSHTGSLAVSDELFSSACRQAGLVMARTIQQAAVTAAAFLERPLPRGRRVGIVTGGGGLGVIAADVCAQAGLIVPALSPEILTRIAGMLPDWWVPGNPIDLVAGLNFTKVPAILDTIMSCGEIDALLLLFIGPRASEGNWEPLNEQSIKMRERWEKMESFYVIFQDLLGQLMRKTGVPILAVTRFGEGSETKKKHQFEPGRAVFLNDLESACEALAGMVAYHEFLARSG
jgi:acyl-CoA synthetase (NDP forming)